jgi:hypothetical protein
MKLGLVINRAQNNNVFNKPLSARPPPTTALPPSNNNANNNNNNNNNKKNTNSLSVISLKNLMNAPKTGCKSCGG